MYKHILVPVDGGELTQKALAHACALAREAGARLTLYHAMPSAFPVFMGGESLVPDIGLDQDYRAAVERRAETVLDAAARTANEAGVAYETLRNDCDSPYEGIVAAAESRGCDLIVMASHGRRGASALLLGSETQKVLTHCTVPVLVYR